VSVVLPYGANNWYHIGLYTSTSRRNALGSSARMEKWSRANWTAKLGHWGPFALFLVRLFQADFYRLTFQGSSSDQRTKRPCDKSGFGPWNVWTRSITTSLAFQYSERYGKEQCSRVSSCVAGGRGDALDVGLDLLVLDESYIWRLHGAGTRWRRGLGFLVARCLASLIRAMPLGVHTRSVTTCVIYRTNRYYNRPVNFDENFPEELHHFGQPHTPAHGIDGHKQITASPAANGISGPRIYSK